MSPAREFARNVNNEITHLEKAEKIAHNLPSWMDLIEFRKYNSYSPNYLSWEKNRVLIAELQGLEVGGS